eukprot:GILK01005555.1.p1 GENE.GILK01005555.1~~GILK01005555.1.p1  ORF type:complete len:427 (-),score=118.32 GILK01005555.1:138-1418(-)
MGKKKGRSSKKTQRTKTDIQDVVDHLEEQRQDAIRAKLANEDLFFVDTEGAKTGQAAGKRKRLEPKAPRPPAKKSKYEEKLIEKLQKTKSSKQDSTDANSTPATGMFDIWEVSDLNSKRKKIKETAPEIIADIVVQKDKRKPDKLGSKISKAPAVQLPRPGQSYNPTFEDHQDVLGEALAAELKRKTQHELYLQKLHPLSWRKRSKQEDAEEDGDGTTVPEADEVGNEESDEGEDGAAAEDNNTKKSTEKYSKTERNRQARLKAKQELFEQEHVKKSIIKDITKIPHIMKQIELEEKAHSTKQTVRNVLKQSAEEQEKHGEILKPKRIGTKLYEPKPIDYMLTEDLPKDLRTLKTNVGAAIKDRFDSIYRRAMIEPHDPLKSKRPREKQMKLYEKGNKTGKQAEMRMAEILGAKPIKKSVGYDITL